MSPQGSMSQAIKNCFPTLKDLIDRLRAPGVQQFTAGAICSQILTDIDLFKFYIRDVKNLTEFLNQLGRPFERSILELMLKSEFCEYLIKDKSSWYDFCELFKEFKHEYIYSELPPLVRMKLSEDGLVIINTPTSPQLFKSASGGKILTQTIMPTSVCSSTLPQMTR